LDAVGPVGRAVSKRKLMIFNRLFSKCQIVEISGAGYGKGFKIGSRVDYAITSQLGKSINQTVLYSWSRRKQM
jgi:hypothetical protein